MKTKNVILVLALLLSNFANAQNIDKCSEINEAKIAIQESVAHIKDKTLFLSAATSVEQNNTYIFSFFMQTAQKFGDIGELVVEKDTCFVTRNSSSAYDINLTLSK